VAAVRESERAYSREYRKRHPIAVKAHYQVALAVYQGRLPQLRWGHNIMCVDCGKYPASCYDHRDYTKPLDVDPVCGSCNKLRGPGYPYNQ
jgi:hypothetical protein